MQNLFFSRTRRRTAHQYIKKKKGGVEAPGVTVMGMYRALTTDTYRLLQIDIRVGSEQKQIIVIFPYIYILISYTN